MICWMAGRGAGFSSGERKCADFGARHGGMLEKMSTIAARYMRMCRGAKVLARKCFVGGFQWPGSFLR